MKVTEMTKDELVDLIDLTAGATISFSYDGYGNEIGHVSLSNGQVVRWVRNNHRRLSRNYKFVVAAEPDDRASSRVTTW